MIQTSTTGSTLVLDGSLTETVFWSECALTHTAMGGFWMRLHKSAHDVTIVMSESRYRDALWFLRRLHDNAPSNFNVFPAFEAVSLK